jgi:hypothetical protein
MEPVRTDVNPTTPVNTCEDAARLLAAFAEVVQELIRLHEEQLQAVLEGDAYFGRFDLLIHMANERKQKAKYEHMRHLEDHGCSQ